MKDVLKVNLPVSQLGDLSSNVTASVLSNRNDRIAQALTQNNEDITLWRSQFSKIDGAVDEALNKVSVGMADIAKGKYVDLNLISLRSSDNKPLVNLTTIPSRGGGARQSAAGSLIGGRTGRQVGGTAKKAIFSESQLVELADTITMMGCNTRQAITVSFSEKFQEHSVKAVNEMFGFMSVRKKPHFLPDHDKPGNSRSNVWFYLRPHFYEKLSVGGDESANDVSAPPPLPAQIFFEGWETAKEEDDRKWDDEVKAKEEKKKKQKEEERRKKKEARDERARALGIDVEGTPGKKKGGKKEVDVGEKRQVESASPASGGGSGGPMKKRKVDASSVGGSTTPPPPPPPPYAPANADADASFDCVVEEDEVDYQSESMSVDYSVDDTASQVSQEGSLDMT